LEATFPLVFAVAVAVLFAALSYEPQAATVRTIAAVNERLAKPARMTLLLFSRGSGTGTPYNPG
jgi:hypothetical protein